MSVDGAAAKNPTIKDQIGSSVKMPISYLQELCTRQNITPEYDLLSVEQAHEATFTFRVSVTDMSAIGQAKNKKTAKHFAAKSLLERIVSVGRYKEFGIGETSEEATQTLLKLGDVVGLEQEEAASSGALTKSDASGGMDNPVGKLQHLCQQKKWPAPAYADVGTEGGPNDHVFVISVTVGKYSTTGSGQNKKLAKRDATIKLLQILEKAMPENQRDFMGITEEDDLAEIGGGRAIIQQPFAELDEHFSSMGQSETVVVPIRDKRGLAILKGLDLASEQPAAEHVSLLKTIGEDENWEPAYYPLPRRSVEGDYLCLVQLSSMPVAVCHGRGPTEEHARQSAAYNALEYLKLMSKN